MPKRMGQSRKTRHDPDSQELSSVSDIIIRRPRRSPVCEDSLHALTKRESSVPRPSPRFSGPENMLGIASAAPARSATERCVYNVYRRGGVAECRASF